MQNAMFDIQSAQFAWSENFLREFAHFYCEGNSSHESQWATSPFMLEKAEPERGEVF
jgi:hypothetical protein